MEQDFQYSQHVPVVSIEEFCDYIITYEKFQELYGYSQVKYYDTGTELYKKRMEVFFGEGRELSEEEDYYCNKKDSEYQELLRTHLNM